LRKRGLIAPFYLFNNRVSRGWEMADIPSHHFIYGTCTDFITGETITDTDDERYRQKLARILVEDKGYSKNDIEVKLKIETLFAKQFVVSTIDFVVSSDSKRVMVIRYGPGSLVTRERPAIAAARVLERSYQIPLTVVTNGEDAEVLDTYTGKVLRQGLDSIPDRNEAQSLLASLSFTHLSEGAKRERELRILNAYDVEVCCVGGPCPLPNAPEG
jgi:hypothetical protein